MSPDLLTHPLHRADGSASFSTNLFTILAAVNGPVEVQRRDELPEEAAIEVNVRPSSGVGGPRERWLESVLIRVLRSVVLVHLHPRTLIQVTLQVTKEPALKIKRGALDVAVLAALGQAAVLALVDGVLPMGYTISASLACVSKEGKVVLEPEEKDLVGSTSVHAQAYTAAGELVMDESAGEFDLGSWQKVTGILRQRCIGAMAKGGEDEDMANGHGDEGDGPWLRKALEEDVRAAAAWREGV